MNYYLSSRATISRLKISRQSWVKALSLARFYGWQPIGTRLPSPSLFTLLGFDPEARDETYFAKNGQMVTTADAHSLARALEKSLDDIPDFDIETDPSLARKEALPFEYFAGNKKRCIVHLIKFCRLGSFLILRI